jgi:hypothetical protein
MNVLITDEDVASALVARGTASRQPAGSRSPRR